MKNNEWNIPTDYFEKNKKEFLPTRKFPNRNWIFALAAACVIGVVFFMLKGEGEKQEVAQRAVEGKKGEDVGAKYLSPEVREGKIMNEKQNENENEGNKGEDVGAKYLSPEVRDGKIGNEKQIENENEGKKEEGIGSKNLSTREDIEEELKEIPREELVEYLIDEDLDFTEQIN